MRQYDLIFVVQPDLDEATLASVVEKVKDLIKTSNGEVVNTHNWGTRRLAYPVRKLHEGTYYFFEVKMDAAAGVELKRNLRFVEQIMRFILKRVG